MPTRIKPLNPRMERWCQEHMPFLSGAEDRGKFFLRVSRFLPEQDRRHQLIKKAYDIAKDAFRDKRRDDGQRYFEHLRAVALILLEYLEICDHEIIIAALLHDLVEDKPEWTVERVRDIFGERTALYVDFLTQPTNEQFGSKEHAEHVYHLRLESAPREVILIKLADRLHNLITLGARPRKKQIGKIAETKRHYLQHARTHLILLPEMRVVLRMLETI